MCMRFRGSGPRGIGFSGGESRKGREREYRAITCKKDLVLGALEFSLWNYCVLAFLHISLLILSKHSDQ